MPVLSKPGSENLIVSRRKARSDEVFPRCPGNIAMGGGIAIGTCRFTPSFNEQFYPKFESGLKNNYHQRP